MKYLVTGNAGFIGFHVTKRLIQQGHEVIGIDNLNDYYDKNLKLARLNTLSSMDEAKGFIEEKQNIQKDGFFERSYSYGSSFNFYLKDLADQKGIQEIFLKHNPEIVINLAAQAGVRYSITNPEAYVSSNLIGFSNILESCRETNVKHLTYASSSSVYGANKKTPFSEKDPVDHPMSLYASTKKSNEMLAHSYSAIHNLPTTGLRFFTAYGPWGRPDMSLFIFTKAILENKPLKIFNHGNHKRDFTYIDDIVEGTILASNRLAKSDEKWKDGYSSSFAPWRIYNVAKGDSIPLMKFVENIERVLNKKAKVEFLPLQPGDVPETHADISLLSKDTGYLPNINVEEGVEKFISWYLNFYN